MELVAGKLRDSMLELGKTDFQKFFEEKLVREKFTGYACITIKEEWFEEAIVFFDAGKIVGFAYEYLKHSKKEFFGKNAFPRVVNCLAARDGCADVFELNGEELHAVLASNPELIYSPSPHSFVKPRNFSKLFEQEALGSAPEKQDFFKRFGIKGV